METTSLTALLRSKSKTSVARQWSKLGGDMVTVVVGQAEVPLTIHQVLINSTCEYLARASKVEWSGTQGKVYLKNEDPQLFNHYVDWFYTREINLYVPDAGYGDPGKAYLWLARLCVLGDFLQDRRLKACCMDAIVEIINFTKAWPHCLAGLAYDTLPEKNALKRLVVEVHIFYVNVDFYGLRRSEMDDYKDIPAELWLDIIHRMQTMGELPGHRWDVKASEYYD